MLLGGIADQEAAVEIFNEIRSAPVELRSDGAHERSEKSGEDDAAPHVRHVIVDDHHVASFGMSEARIQNDSGESGENPGPRAQRVMRDVKPKNGEEAVALITRAEDALRDVAAPTGFRAGIPERPPLHAEIDT